MCKYIYIAFLTKNLVYIFTHGYTALKLNEHDLDVWRTSTWCEYYFRLRAFEGRAGSPRAFCEAQENRPHSLFGFQPASHSSRCPRYSLQVLASPVVRTHSILLTQFLSRTAPFSRLMPFRLGIKSWTKPRLWQPYVTRVFFCWLKFRKIAHEIHHIHLYTYRGLILYSVTAFSVFEFERLCSTLRVRCQLWPIVPLDSKLCFRE